MSDDEEGYYSVSASLGSLYLEVDGEDEEWVSEEFDEKLDRLLEEAEEMEQAVRDGSRGCM